MKPSINNKISVLGVSIDLGADTRGVNMGPTAIRYSGLVKRLETIGYQVEDIGNIVADMSAKQYCEGTNLKHLDEVVRVNTEICDAIDNIMKAGRFPLVLGGDHSIAIGTIAGILQHKKNLGVVWFDAHGDINTEETTTTGNIHGMSVAVGLGLGHKRLTEIGGAEAKLNPKHIVYIGCRDLDIGERKILKDNNITVFTMHEIDRLGMPTVIERAVYIASNGTDGIHVSFDMDCMDPLYAPGTGTRVPGGLTYRECHLAMEVLATSDKVISAEFVEVNPMLDEKNITAETAVALIGSLLGEWLL